MNIGLAVQSVCTEFERLWADDDWLVAPRARLRVLVLVRVCVRAHAHPQQGSELHQTLEEMRAAEDAKYTKSHKKFKFFDADVSDFVTREEFEAGLKKLGYKTTAKKLDHIMKELDVDEDGRVEFTEFLRPTAKKYKEEQLIQSGADTDRAMEHFDRNFDGRVSAEELFTGLSHLQRAQSLKEEEVKGFVRDYADRDGDGFLSYEELEKIDPAIL